MYKVILGLVFFSLFTIANDELDAVLDNFHQAAGEANYDKYIDLLAQDAIYLGTDSGERWNKKQFAAFVKPYKTKQGWKILQYNLSIPVPNAIAREVVKSIKVYRTSNK